VRFHPAFHPKAQLIIQTGRSSGSGFTEILPIDEAKTLLNSGNIFQYLSMVNSQWSKTHHLPITIHCHHSYGDSAGFTPASLLILPLAQVKPNPPQK